MPEVLNNNKNLSKVTSGVYKCSKPSKNFLKLLEASRITVKIPEVSRYYTTKSSKNCQTLLPVFKPSLEFLNLLENSRAIFENPEAFK